MHTVYAALCCMWIDCVAVYHMCVCVYVSISDMSPNNRYTGKTYVSYAMLETLIVIPCIINTEKWFCAAGLCCIFARLNWIIRAGSMYSHVKMEFSDFKNAKSFSGQWVEPLLRNTSQNWPVQLQKLRPFSRKDWFRLFLNHRRHQRTRVLLSVLLYKCIRKHLEPAPQEFIDCRSVVFALVGAVVPL